MSSKTVYDYNGGNITNPPSGTVNQYTMVMAENDGKAIIDGQKLRRTISIREIPIINRGI